MLHLQLVCKSDTTYLVADIVNRSLGARIWKWKAAPTCSQPSQLASDADDNGDYRADV